MPLAAVDGPQPPTGVQKIDSEDKLATICDNSVTHNRRPKRYTGVYVTEYLSGCLRYHQSLATIIVG